MRQLSYYFIVIVTLCLSIGCNEEPQSYSDNETIEASSQNIAEMIDETELTQQLPLELELSTAEKEEYFQILDGIYAELTTGNETTASSAASDPTQSCDRCGRETGFLPNPEIFMNSFLHVEMKAFTFGLVSWSIDFETVLETLNDLLGDEAPSTVELSYRLTIVRVDLASFDTTMIEQANNGTLLANQAPESVSITSVTTDAEEFGVNLDHGYSYLLYVHAIETVTKLTSTPSEPVMIHCFNSDQDQDNGGCLQLAISTAN